MTGRAPLNGETLTVRVPLVMRRRGGRRLVVAPERAGSTPTRSRVNSTILKALARAHRWKRLIEGGRFASLLELAEAEQINQSYLCRVLRLTLLAPDVVEAILDGRQPVGLQLAALLSPLPMEWGAQRKRLEDGSRTLGPSCSVWTLGCFRAGTSSNTRTSSREPLCLTEMSGGGL